MPITRRNFVKKSGYAVGTLETFRNLQEFSDQPFTKEGTIDRIEINQEGNRLMVILVPNHREKQFVTSIDKAKFCPQEGDKVSVTYQKKAPSKDTEVLKVEKK